jgi:membrane protease YdiL (CAAX protease family)
VKKLLVPNCPSCKKEAPLEKKFCTECGYNLKEAREKKRRQKRVKKLRESRASALKNTYLLLMMTGLPLMALIIAGRLGVDHNNGMIYCGWGSATLICSYIFFKKPILDLNRKTAIKWALIGLLLSPIILLLNFGYHGLLTSLFELSKQMSRSEMMLNSGMSILGIFFYVSIMPAVWEEIMFRGLLLKELEVIISPLEAAVLSSVLFSLIHLSIFSFPYLAGLHTSCSTAQKRFIDSWHGTACNS